MAKHELILKTDTVTLTKGNDGYWLYDKTVGMNLAMRSNTEQAAFLQAIEYYQKRLSNVEGRIRKFKN